MGRGRAFAEHGAAVGLDESRWCRPRKRHHPQSLADQRQLSLLKGKGTDTEDDGAFEAEGPSAKQLIETPLLCCPSKGFPCQKDLDSAFHNQTHPVRAD